ncbi:MAG: MnmC family methyltransferase [Bacteriovoracaceae bacterium]
MKTPSQNYQWIQTDDGSYTLHSELFKEACHSTSGAKSETLLHYLQGCQVSERLTKYSPFQILEVGFGLGIGFLTTLETLGEFDHPWHFVTMEIDPDLVKWFLDVYQDHHIVKQAVWISPRLVHAKFKNVEISIIVGDARIELPHFLNSGSFQFHAIFQDAFSPKRNPTLWTVEWFNLLRETSHQDCILSTYSASSSIRKSLIKSGWKVNKGHKFGPKRSSTRATLTGVTDEEIMTHLNNSPVEAIYDESIKDFIKSFSAN